MNLSPIILNDGTIPENMVMMCFQISTNSPASWGVTIKIVDREEAVFKQLHPLLREKYLGQYVAIYQDKLIDHDANQVVLYWRVKERYPDEFVWIAPVGETSEETYVLRSPRFVESAS